MSAPSVSVKVAASACTTTPASGAWLLGIVGHG
jgi:hypothetical protein